MSDPYVLPNGTLDNLLGISDAKNLEEAERDLSRARMLDCDRTISGPFDFNRLRTIHHHLFQDVYAWAGKTRTTPLGKQAFEDLTHTTWFTHPTFIETHADRMFRELTRRKNLKNLPSDKFASTAGDLLAALNTLHPFREGNGRTNRQFMTQIANEAGHDLDFSIIPRERMIRASIAASNKDTLPMRRIFDDMLSPEREAALRKAISFLQANGIAWNDISVAHTAPGNAYHGTVAGIAGPEFMMRDGNDIIIGRTGDLPENVSRGMSVSFVAQGKRGFLENAPQCFLSKPNDAFQRTR